MFLIWPYWPQHHGRPPHIFPHVVIQPATPKKVHLTFRYPCGNIGSNTKMAHLTSRSPFGHTGSNAKGFHPTLRYSICPYCQQHQNGSPQISFAIWPHSQRHHNGHPRISFPYLSILSAPTFATTGTLKLFISGGPEIHSAPVWFCAPNAVLTCIPPPNVSQVH